MATTPRASRSSRLETPKSGQKRRRGFDDDSETVAAEEQKTPAKQQRIDDGGGGSGSGVGDVDQLAPLAGAAAVAVVPEAEPMPLLRLQQDEEPGPAAVPVGEETESEDSEPDTEESGEESGGEETEVKDDRGKEEKHEGKEEKKKPKKPRQPLTDAQKKAQAATKVQNSLLMKEGVVQAVCIGVIPTTVPEIITDCLNGMMFPLWPYREMRKLLRDIRLTPAKDFGWCAYEPRFGDSEKHRASAFIAALELVTESTVTYKIKWGGRLLALLARVAEYEQYCRRYFDLKRRGASSVLVDGAERSANETLVKLLALPLMEFSDLNKSLKFPNAFDYWGFFTRYNDDARKVELPEERMAEFQTQMREFTGNSTELNQQTKDQLANMRSERLALIFRKYADTEPVRLLGGIIRRVSAAYSNSARKEGTILSLAAQVLETLDSKRNPTAKTRTKAIKLANAVNLVRQNRDAYRGFQHDLCWCRTGNELAFAPKIPTRMVKRPHYGVGPVAKYDLDGALAVAAADKWFKEDSLINVPFAKFIRAIVTCTTCRAFPWAENVRQITGVEDETYTGSVTAELWPSAPGDKYLLVKQSFLPLFTLGCVIAARPAHIASLYALWIRFQIFASNGKGATATIAATQEPSYPNNIDAWLAADVTLRDFIGGMIPDARTPAAMLRMSKWLHRLHTDNDVRNNVNALVASEIRRRLPGMEARAANVVGVLDGQVEQRIQDRLTNYFSIAAFGTDELVKVGVKRVTTDPSPLRITQSGTGAVSRIAKVAGTINSFHYPDGTIRQTFACFPTGHADGAIRFDLEMASRLSRYTRDVLVPSAAETGMVDGGEDDDTAYEQAAQTDASQTLVDVFARMENMRAAAVPVVVGATAAAVGRAKATTAAAKASREKLVEDHNKLINAPSVRVVDFRLNPDSVCWDVYFPDEPNKLLSDFESPELAYEFLARHANTMQISIHLDTDIKTIYTSDGKDTVATRESFVINDERILLEIQKMLWTTLADGDTRFKNSIRAKRTADRSILEPEDLEQLGDEDDLLAMGSGLFNWRHYNTAFVARHVLRRVLVPSDLMRHIPWIYQNDSAFFGLPAATSAMTQAELFVHAYAQVSREWDDAIARDPLARRPATPMITSVGVLVDGLLRTQAVKTAQMALELNIDIRKNVISDEMRYNNMHIRRLASRFNMALKRQQLIKYRVDSAVAKQFDLFMTPFRTKADERVSVFLRSTGADRKQVTREVRQGRERKQAREHEPALMLTDAQVPLFTAGSDVLQSEVKPYVSDADKALWSALDGALGFVSVARILAASCNLLFGDFAIERTWNTLAHDTKDDKTNTKLRSEEEFTLSDKKTLIQFTVAANIRANYIQQHILMTLPDDFIHICQEVAAATIVALVTARSPDDVQLPDAKWFAAHSQQHAELVQFAVDFFQTLFVKNVVGHRLQPSERDDMATAQEDREDAKRIPTLADLSEAKLEREREPEPDTKQETAVVQTAVSKELEALVRGKDHAAKRKTLVFLVPATRPDSRAIDMDATYNLWRVNKKQSFRAAANILRDFAAEYDIDGDAEDEKTREWRAEVRSMEPTTVPKLPLFPGALLGLKELVASYTAVVTRIINHVATPAELETFAATDLRLVRYLYTHSERCIGYLDDVFGTPLGGRIPSVSVEEEKFDKVKMKTTRKRDKVARRNAKFADAEEEQEGSGDAAGDKVIEGTEVDEEDEVTRKTRHKRGEAKFVGVLLHNARAPKPAHLDRTSSTNEEEQAVSFLDFALDFKDMGFGKLDESNHRPRITTAAITAVRVAVEANVEIRLRRLSDRFPGASVSLFLVAARRIIAKAWATRSADTLPLPVRQGRVDALENLRAMVIKNTAILIGFMSERVEFAKAAARDMRAADKLFHADHTEFTATVAETTAIRLGVFEAEGEELPTYEEELLVRCQELLVRLEKADEVFYLLTLVRHLADIWDVLDVATGLERTAIDAGDIHDFGRAADADAAEPEPEPEVKDSGSGPLAGTSSVSDWAGGGAGSGSNSSPEQREAEDAETRVTRKKKPQRMTTGKKPKKDALDSNMQTSSDDDE